MAPRSCPLKFDRKCKWCPITDYFTRLGMCNYFRGQIISGVPWHWGALRGLDEDGFKALQRRAFEIESERKSR